MKIVNEKDGDRKYDRISRWNVLEETIISEKSKHAPYADNFDYSKGKQADKLFLTYFKLNGRVIPFNKFAILFPPITLEDRSVISRCDTESGIYLEVDAKARKVRMYRKVD